MAGEKAVWGIDVGQCALKALKLQVVEGVVEAAAFDIVEHTKPLNPGERGGEELVQLLSQAVQTLIGRNQMAGEPVVIGVPGYQAFMRFTKLPPVEKKQLPAIVQFEAGQQIPYEIDQVIWDYQIFSEEGGPDVEVGIFCMRNELLDRYLTPFTDAGLQPVVVQPAPLALYNFLEHDAHRRGKATVLLDIGAESTDLIVSDRGSVWTRAIPIGGNNFTERLVEAFRLEFSKAEGLKQSAATSKYARQVFQAMRPVYQDLVSEIQRSIGRYSQTHREAELDRVVGMGNGFRLPGLQKFLQQNLGMKVERVSAFNQLQPGPSVNAPTLNENVLSLGVAYGLAVQGLGRGQIDTSLLPPQIAKRAVWHRKRPWFAATAACLLLAAVSLWARYLLDSTALARNAGSEPMMPPTVSIQNIPRTVRQSPDGKLARAYTLDILSCAKKLSSEWGRLNSEVNKGSQEVQDMLVLLADQSLWSKIVNVIHGALPEGDKALVTAKTRAEYLAATKKIERKKRMQIFIDSFDVEYKASVAAELEQPGEPEQTGKRPARKTTAKRSKKVARGGRGGRADGRGFIITLEAWTPHKDLRILDEFCEALRESGNPKDPAEAAALGFHIVMPARVENPRYRDPHLALRADEEAKELKAPDTDEPQGDDPTRDPVTHESWVSDWVFALRFGVVLGPSSEASAASKERR